MMFTGTTQQQDTRFSDKEKKLMKQMKFGDCLNKRVDMSKVKLDVLRPWISKKITDILHIEDDVVVEFVYNQLEEEKYPCPKKMQINMTGFLNGRNARQFMGELWSLLLSAQESDSGIPAEFIHRKKDEILKRESVANNESYHQSRLENNQMWQDEEGGRSDNGKEGRFEINTQKEREKGISAAVEHLRSKLQIDVRTSTSETNSSRSSNKKDIANEFFDLDSQMKEKSSKTKNSSDDTVQANTQVPYSKKRSSENHGTISTDDRQSLDKYLKDSSQSPRKRSTENDEQYKQKSQSSSSKLRRNHRRDSPQPNERSPFRYRSHSRNRKSQSPSAENKKKEENKASERSKRSRSFTLNQNGSPRSPNFRNKKNKYSEQPRHSRLSKSPDHSLTVRNIDRRRDRSISCGSTSRSGSSNIDKKGIEIRKTKSIQTKRHYRNNRCSSASSAEGESKAHHRRESKHRESNKQGRISNRRNIQAEYEDMHTRRSASRRHSRSPRVRSRSPRKSPSPRWYGRRRSPPSFRARWGNNRNNRTSNPWRRSFSRTRNRYDRRFSPQRRLSREGSRNHSRERSVGRRGATLKHNDRLHQSNQQHQQQQRVFPSEKIVTRNKRSKERWSHDRSQRSSSNSDTNEKESTNDYEKRNNHKNNKIKSNKKEAKIKTQQSSDDDEDDEATLVRHESIKKISPSNSTPDQKKKRNKRSLSLNKTQNNVEAEGNRSTDIQKNRAEKVETDSSNKKCGQASIRKDFKTESKNTIKTIQKRDISLSRTPSPFLKSHERETAKNAESNVNASKRQKFAASEKSREKQVHNVEANSIAIHKEDQSGSQQKTDASDQKRNRAQPLIVATKSETTKISGNSLISKNEEAISSVQGKSVLNVSGDGNVSTKISLAKVEKVSEHLQSKFKNKKIAKTTSENDSSDNSNTEPGNKRKKKMKKPKKHGKKSKKHKKHKKKTKKSYRSSSSDDDDDDDDEEIKERYARPSSQTVPSHESSILFGDVNDDLEKKLRERALKSMRRVD